MSLLSEWLEHFQDTITIISTVGTSFQMRSAAGLAFRSTFEILATPLTWSRPVSATTSATFAWNQPTTNHLAQRATCQVQRRLRGFHDRIKTAPTP